MLWKRLRNKVRNPQMRFVLDKIVSGETPVVPTLPVLSTAPIIGVAATVDVEASEIGIMNNGDTITFEGVEFTKAAALSAEDGEFASSANLNSCVNELLGDDWTAADEGGDSRITSDTAGAIYNSRELVIRIKEATTAGGDDSGDQATADISKELLAELADGDVITFAGLTMTKKTAAPSADAYEFSTPANLWALIDALNNWEAESDLDDGVTITAATDSSDFNGWDVRAILYRKTADGVNATTAKKGNIFLHDGDIYVALDDLGTDNTDIAEWDVVDTTAHE